MRNNLTLCIWGDGPARLYDNIYDLKSATFNDNILHLYFADDEECIITNPKDIVFTDRVFQIVSAEKIVWTFYYYGKPKSDETLTTTEYNLIDKEKVNVIAKGWFGKNKIISIKRKLAFDSFGDINIILRAIQK